MNDDLGCGLLYASASLQEVLKITKLMTIPLVYL